jgi:uncharacterized membrane protein
LNNNIPKFLINTLTFQAIVCISIILNVPYLRQVLGFLFLVFVPGYLLLRVFKVEKSHLSEIIVYSAGLSIAFIMLVGFVLNEFGLLGILPDPLATAPLFIVVNIIVACLCIISYTTNKSYKGLKPEALRKFWHYLPFFALPLLSVTGVLLVRYFNSNLLLTFVFLLIVVVFVATALKSKLSAYYPLILLSIVLAILLSTALMSNYLYGDDIQGEFNRFLVTKTALIWQPSSFFTYQQMSDNSMLSLTVFPTMLSNLLNVGPTSVLKIIYLCIFSLVPIGLYEIYRKQWSDRIAFVAVVFFMANFAFFVALLQEAKQMIAEVFYVILFLELLNNDVKSYKSSWMIVVLALFGIVVSHYSMSFIFILLTLFTWLGGKLLFRKSVKKINAQIIAFTSSLVFFWYLYIVPAGPFYKFVGIIQTIFGNFITEFFSSNSRGVEVQSALGLAARPSTLHYIGTYLYDITILLILVGFIVLLIAWRRKRINSEFCLLITFDVGLLVSTVAVPNFSGMLQLGRLYEVILMFLSPLFVLGSEAIFKSILKVARPKNPLNLNFKKQNATIAMALTLIILAVFFLFQSGVIYEISNDPAPSNFSLSYSKFQNSPILIHECDLFSAKWLSNYGDISYIPTYADTVSYTHVVESYSTINDTMLFLLSNDTQVYQNPGLLIHVREMANASYIYLSQFNVVNQLIRWDTSSNTTYHFSELPILNSTTNIINRIYSNGASEIQFQIPKGQ